MSKRVFDITYNNNLDFNTISWNVMYNQFNDNKIVVIDIIERELKVIKECLKESTSIEEFADKLRICLMSKYWSRSQYEVIMTSWPPRIDKEELDRISNEEIKYTTDVNLTVAEKIDIYVQLKLNWSQFVSYLYNNKDKLKVRKVKN